MGLAAHAAIESIAVVGEDYSYAGARWLHPFRSAADLPTDSDDFPGRYRNGWLCSIDRDWHGSWPGCVSRPRVAGARLLRTDLLSAAARKPAPERYLQAALRRARLAGRMCRSRSRTV